MLRNFIHTPPTVQKKFQSETKHAIPSQRLVKSHTKTLALSAKGKKTQKYLRVGDAAASRRRRRSDEESVRIEEGEDASERNSDEDRGGDLRSAQRLAGVLLHQRNLPTATDHRSSHCGFGFRNWRFAISTALFNNIITITAIISSGQFQLDIILHYSIDFFRVRRESIDIQPGRR